MHQPDQRHHPGQRRLRWSRLVLLLFQLTNVVFGYNVDWLGGDAFYGCPKLPAAYFRGDAPWFIYIYNGSRFLGPFEITVTLRYLPGTTGRGPTLGYLTAAPWSLPYPVILSYGPSYGIRTNVFGFRVSWATNTTVVVQTSTNLAAPVWQALATNTIGGSSVPTNGVYQAGGQAVSGLTNRVYVSKQLVI